jgi:hypothetical protein
MKCNPSLGVQDQSKNHSSFSSLFFEVPEASQRPEQHGHFGDVIFERCSRVDEDVRKRRREGVIFISPAPNSS